MEGAYHKTMEGMTTAHERIVRSCVPWDSHLSFYSTPAYVKLAERVPDGSLYMIPLRQGANYYYLYYVRACAKPMEELLRLKSESKCLDGTTEQFYLFGDTGKDRFKELPESKCKGELHCGASCWKPICRTCFLKRNLAHPQAFTEMLGGSISKHLMGDPCATDHCVNSKMPTCDGHCYTHRHSERLSKDLIYQTLVQQEALVCFPTTTYQVGPIDNRVNISFSPILSIVAEYAQ